MKQDIFSGLRAAALVFWCIFSAGTAFAEAAPAVKTDMLEYALPAAAETHMPLRLKLSAFGKSQLVRLDEEVSHVTVDDQSPTVTAVIYDQKSIAIFPKKLGAAHITVYGKNDKVIMARYVIVFDPAEKYARIRQTCQAEKSPSCNTAQVYYCPNLCYRTHMIGFAGPQKLTLK